MPDKHINIHGYLRKNWEGDCCTCLPIRRHCSVFDRHWEGGVDSSSLGQIDIGDPKDENLGILSVIYLYLKTTQLTIYMLEPIGLFNQ